MRIVTKSGVQLFARWYVRHFLPDFLMCQLPVTADEVSGVVLAAWHCHTHDENGAPVLCKLQSQGRGSILTGFVPLG